MALTFGGATSDRVFISASSSIDDFTAFTCIMWAYPTAWTNFRRVWAKGVSGSDGLKQVRLLTSPSNILNIEVARATTGADARATTGVTLNKWWCWAITYDETDGPRIFHGDLTTRMAEATYSATPTVGSGATTVDNSGGFYVGNRPSLANAFPGQIASFQYINARLTLAELIRLQWRQTLLPSTRLMMALGKINGTGTQIDLSGNGNSGTVTGATLATRDLPFLPVHRPTRQPRIIFPTGFSQAIGLHTETDAVLAIAAKAKSKAIGLNTETDAVLSPGAAKSKAIGLNTETDAVLAVGISSAVTLGLVTEADSVLTVSASKSKAIGLNAETDTILPPGVSKASVLALLSETDAVLAVSASKSKPVALITETDEVLAIITGIIVGLGLVTETDEVLATAVVKAKALGLVTETDEVLRFLNAPGGQILIPILRRRRR